MASIGGILNEEQMSRLPPELQDEMRRYGSEQAAREADLQNKYERLRVDSEQRYFELEQLQQSEHGRLDAESKAASDLRLVVSDLEKRYNEISEKYRDLQTKFFEKDKHWNQQEQVLLQRNSSLESERAELIDTLNKRNAEVERLTDEYKLISEKLNEEIRIRLTAQTSADEAKSEMMVMQHRDGRLNQELKNLHEQNEILNQQLHERFNETMAVRKEKSVRLMELQSLLDDATAQVSRLEHSLEASKATEAEQSAQIESYVEKLKEARDGHIQIEEQYRNELVAQEKLLNLYKTTAKEGETKVQEMAKAVEELQQLLSQATQAYSDLKSEQEDLTKDSQEQISQRDDHIQSMEKELARANELLEVMKRKAPSYISEDDAQILSPAAAAASRLLKSGMTLTQIYSEYADTLSQLQQEKDENARLTNYLDTILQEIEEKAPLIKKQKVDYEEALETIDRLTLQLDASLQECEKCRQSADENHRRSGELRRQNDRQVVQLKDLSLQVRMLLKELEEARGTVVHMTTDDGRDDSSSEVTSSSLLISEKLVSFRSIEELQEQNQRLLQVVRELSEMSEENEKKKASDSDESQRVTELRGQLEVAQAEIEQMRAARERQAGLVESLVQQRDMFKTMAMSSQVPLSPRVPIRSPISSTPGVLAPAPATSAASPVVTVLGEQDQKALQETRIALKELQEEFLAYRTEKGQNEKMLSEQLDKVNQEASGLRLQSAKLASQLAFSNERYKILQSNVESHKREIEALRDRNQKLSDSVTRHQQTVTLLREEAKMIQERLSAAEIRNQGLTREKEMLKSAEGRMVAELEAVRRDSQSRDTLLVNLQVIQNNLERTEFETKTRFGHRIEALERENAVLRKKADGTEEQQKAFIVTLERQLDEARNDADMERTKVLRLTEQLNTTASHISLLQQELLAAEAKVVASEAKVSDMNEAVKELQSQTDPSQKLNEEIRNQRICLEEASAKIRSLEEKLNQSQKHAEQYKSISDGLEASLRDQNEASRQFRESLEAQLAEAQQAREVLTSELNELEHDRQRILEENEALVSENKRILSERTQLVNDSSQSSAVSVERIQILEKELSEVIDSRDIALANEATARHDCEVQAREAKEAQNKYERELMLHAADVETMTQIKQELESVGAKLAVAENEAKEALSMRLAAQESWLEQESLFQKEITLLHERLSTLQSQNNTLHQELDKMAEQMKEMQSQRDRDETQGKQLAESVEKDANPKTADQLLEVIRYLRREKEFAEATHDVINAEVNRLRHEVTLLKKKLESSEQALVLEVERAAVKVESAAQHAELMRRVETLNLLQDSNQLLRSQNERMTQQLKELEAKNTRLETEIEPLKDSANDLTAQRDAAKREIEILKEEVERWRSRTNRLIEQYSKFDPEELKRALDDRDQMKRQLDVVSVECQSVKNEVSRLTSQVAVADAEVKKAREESAKLSEELEATKASIAVKDADDEEKAKTILQLRKIGRKYRMQAEEALAELKELKELKAKGFEEATAEINEKLRKAEQETEDLQNKLKQSSAELGQANSKLQSTELEKNESLRQAKSAEEREKELREQLNKVRQELSKASEEKSNMADSHLKSVEEKDKMVDEFNRLTEENRGLKDDRDKLEEQKNGAEEESRKTSEQIKELEKKYSMTRNLVISAKQRLEEQKAEIEKVNAENVELKRKTEEDRDERTRLNGEVENLRQKLDQQASAEEMELRMSTVRSQFEGKINRLERELAERTHEAEAAERLRRENQELQQRVNVLQSQMEAFQRQAIGQSPSKPTISAPPVERSGTGSGDVSQRRTIIKPMPTAVPTMSQRHSAPVQPVRSTAGIAAEPRTMVASIRPMAVASTQPTTPMATVMPTTMSLPENEGSAPNVLSQSSTTTAAAVMSQGRPTQSVQPVSSHVEESTVSSSEEPVLDGMQPLVNWWHEHPTPSTSSEHSVLLSGAGTTSSSTSGMSSKRPREEMRLQDEGGAENDEAPPKRSKMLRRRELEPVSTSLAMEDLSRNSDLAQDDHAPHKGSSSVDQAEGVVGLPSDDLPDYPEMEQTEYDTRPSTSRQHGSDVDEQSNQESINQSEPRDDAEEMGAEMQPQDDVICVEEEEEEEDEEEEGTESGVAGQRADMGYSEEEEEDYNRTYQDPEEVEEIEDEEFEMEDKDDGGVDAYGGIDADIQVEGEESTNDVIVVDDEAAAGTSEGDRHRDRSSDDVILQDDSAVPVSAVSTSQPHQVMQRHTGVSAGRVASAPPSDGGGAMRVIPHQVAASSRSYGSQMHMASRAQLMPFLFATEVGGSGFEIGDDGIVPSTPTLQVTVRTDGFAEAVSSPQVTDEFTFGSSSESVPQLELTQQQQQQRGIAVDDTRMDLSQFDEHSGRGPLTTPPCSQTSPAFPAQNISTDEHFHDQSMKQSDPVPSCSSPGNQEESTSDEARRTSMEVSSDGRPSGLDERPSTSESSSQMETHAQSKPKIKKIVWQEPSREDVALAGAAAPSGGQQQVSSQQQQLAPQQGTSQARRGYSRGGYRGRASTAAAAQQQQQQQQPVRPLLAVHLGPPQAQSPQVARRARGSRGATSNAWSARQQHYQ